jgi:hypothetical protein
MDQLSLDLLKQLGRHQEPGCVSLYVPTGVQGVDAEKRRLELKNLLTEIDHDRGASLPDSVNQKLKQIDLHAATSGLEDVGTRIFLFSPSASWEFEIRTQLEPLARVGEHFYLMPLLGLWAYEEPHYLLKLSLKQVELFELTGLTMRPVSFRIPAHLQESYGKHIESWSLKTFQEIRDDSKHSNKPPLMQQSRDRYYGASKQDKHDIRDADLLLYLKHIDTCLLETVPDHKRPMILAADEHVGQLYQSTSHYSSIRPEMIVGNPDRIARRELHEKAFAIIKANVEHNARSQSEQLANLSHTGKALDNLDKLEVAATSGVIKDLFIVQDFRRRLPTEPAAEQTAHADTVAENRDDKLNRIAAQTLTHGGRIFWLDHQTMPSQSPAAAVLYSAM